MIIKGMEAAKEVSTVDTTNTVHAFLAPEYWKFFYLLCGMALLVYCPVIMWAGYRQCLAERSGRPCAPPTGGRHADWQIGNHRRAAIGELVRSKEVN